MKFELVEKVFMELSPSGKAVVVVVDGEKFATSRKFVQRLLDGHSKRLKLRRRKAVGVAPQVEQRGIY